MNVTILLRIGNIFTTWSVKDAEYHRKSFGQMHWLQPLR
jgi:hypothetical protein